MVNSGGGSPLSKMIGSGGQLIIQDRTYRVKPLKVKQIDEFTSDNLSIGPQIFNLSNEDSKVKTDKWVKAQLTDDKGEPMSLKRIADEDWDMADLKKFFEELIGLSG